MTVIARAVNPFVVYSIGYVGEDVESVISKLLQEANYNVERCQQGLKLTNGSLRRDGRGLFQLQASCFWMKSIRLEVCQVFISFVMSVAKVFSR